MGDTLVDWLKRQIDQAGSIRALARDVGISHTTMAQVLSGTRAPTYEFCVAVAGAVNEPPERVLRLAGLLPIRSGADEGGETLRFYYEQLSPADQLRLIDIAKTLVEQQERYEAGASARPAADGRPLTAEG